MATDPDEPTITKDRKAPQEQDPDQDAYEEAFESSSCISRIFCFPCGCRNADKTEHRSLLQGEYKESWWMNRLKRIKEFTELVAGPKWKTFIRRFSHSHNTSKKRKTQFQYDPLSYALNFDAGADDEDYGGGRVNF